MLSFFAMSTMLLEAFPVTGFVAHGVRDSVLGSSGTSSRYSSRFLLKTSTPQPVRSLNSFGILLKVLGPQVWKEFSFIFRSDPDVLVIGGILQSLPLRWLLVSSIPQFGMRPSSIFHVSIME